MHIAADIFAVLALLFFFLSGWHKGLLLSLLGIVRVAASCVAAYFSGRYLGVWMGGVADRPRIVIIPLCATLTFMVVTLAFRLTTHHIRKQRAKREVKEDFKVSFLSCLAGATINLAGGTIVLVLIFWLMDIFMVCISGQPTPGSSEARSSRIVHRVIYETTYFFISKTGNAQQASSIARIASHPEKGKEHLGNILAADSVQNLFRDPTLTDDLLTGDPERIKQNPAIQQLLNDRATLDELKEIGFLSGYETKADIADKLARIGRNERIQSSMENLKEKQLLSPDKFSLLIRDRDFDTIVCELVR